jgi:hypothetical protein
MKPWREIAVPDREPGLGVSSINHSLTDLLQKVQSY